MTKPTVQCPMCGSERCSIQENIVSTDLNEFYAKGLGISHALKSKSLNYLVCPDCSLGFFDPMETGDESLYERLQAFDWYYMTHKYEYEVATKYLPANGNVLEVGAGKAAFADVVGEERYTGLEFNDKAIERANLAGIRLLKQTVQAHAAEGHSYDAVVSFQVLEHVAEPAAFLRGCVQCLKPGGHLIIGVPAHDGFIGNAINSILDMPPHHVTHWSGETLKKLASLLGLELSAIEYEPVAEYHQSWARKTVWELRLRGLFGMRLRLLDVSLLHKSVSKMASILAKIFPVSVDGLKGHTVVAVYKKS